MRHTRCDESPRAQRLHSLLKNYIFVFLSPTKYGQVYYFDSIKFWNEDKERERRGKQHADLNVKNAEFYRTHFIDKCGSTAENIKIDSWRVRFGKREQALSAFITHCHQRLLTKKRNYQITKIV